MLVDAPPPAAGKPALSLDWTTQKSKEDALTRAALLTLEAFFGKAARVRTLEGFEAQRQGDFAVTLPGGKRLTVEAKFEDYPNTWFTEVLQLVAGTGGAPGRIEPGWVYKTPAHLLLYTSTVTGVAVLVPRREILEIQVGALHALMLASRELEVPLMLNATLNPASGGGFSRAGVGLGLLRKQLVARYLERCGTRGLFLLDARQALRAMQQGFGQGGSHVARWARETVLGQPFSRQGLEGVPQAKPGALAGGLEALEFSDRPIGPHGLGFFQAALLEGLVTGQTWLAAAVAGEYRRLPGASEPELARVAAPLAAREYAPGPRGHGSVLGLQNRALGQGAGVQRRELAFAGFAERCQAYLEKTRKTRNGTLSGTGG